MPSPTRRASLAATTLLLSSGLAGTAAAATPTPPAVDYAYDTAGQLASYGGVLSISQDGSDVLFRHLPDSNIADLELLARNRVTNTTTRILPVGDDAWGASANDQRVLYKTTKALDPADRNLTADFYVLDRKTGVSTVVSRGPGGLAAGKTSDVAAAAAISGDGNSVVYDWNDGTGPQVLRYVPATGVVSKVGPGSLMSTGRLDTAGSGVVTSAGLVSHGQTFPLPFTPPTGYTHTRRAFRFAPDGSAVAEERIGRDFRDVIVTSATTGAQTTLPQLPFDQGVHLLGVANGGGSVLVARGLSDTVDEADRITTAGTITPLATLPAYAARGPLGIASADGAFVADSQLFQIGTSTGAGPAPTPIPDAKLLPPSGADAVRAVTYYPGCSAGGLFAPLLRPSVVLGTAATTTNPRTPSAATIRAIDDATGSVLSTVTVKAGARASLTVGWGGFTLTDAVTFSDGTKATGLRHIDVYPPFKNDTNPFTGKGSCKTQNGL